MMTDTDRSPDFPWVRKLIVPMIGGAVVGGLATFGLLSWIDTAIPAEPEPSILVAAAVAAFYLVVAAITAVGTLNPQLGARYLNVEDADELREVRKMLLLSAGGMALWGAALLALALAAPAGPLPIPAALTLGVAGLAGGGVFAVMSYRLADELMVAVNLEAGAVSYGLVLLVIGGWGMLAHLGYVAGPQPLDLLTSFYILVMLATFIAAARRGMLAIR